MSMGKKYVNPISRAVTVEVPRWEYAALVAAKAKLDMVERVLTGMDGYDAVRAVRLMLKEADMDE